MNLKNNFPAFINELNALPDGLPNVHIAVVSTDLQGGNLQTNGTTLVSGSSISDTKNTDGGKTTDEMRRCVPRVIAEDRGSLVRS